MGLNDNNLPGHNNFPGLYIAMLQGLMMNYLIFDAVSFRFFSHGQSKVLL